VSREDALAFRARVKQQVATEQLLGSLGAFDTLVTKFLTSCERHLWPRPVERYRGALQNVCATFGHLPLKEIPPLAVEEYQQQQLAAGRHPRTMNREIRILLQLATWAFQVGFLKEKPARRFRYLREPQGGRRRVLNEDEESCLIVACPLKLRSLVVIALQTDLRWNELLTLTSECVDLTACTLIIQAQSSRNRQEGLVPLNDIAIHTFMAIRPPVAEGSVFALSHVDGIFRRVVKRAGLLEVSPHTQRHTFGTRLIVADVPLGIVKELMRHSKIETTMLYSHPQLDHLHAAVNRLSEPAQPLARSAGDIPNV
jgi:site-specific recombinase XerD